MPIKLTENDSIDSNNAYPLHADIYQPSSPSQTAILFMHGGAWKAGSPKQFEQWARYFAEQHGYLCACLDYRLSGEAPFPAAVEDVMQTTLWLRQDQEIKQVIYMGTSAGANIAATAMTSKERFKGEQLSDQLDFNCNLAVLLNGEYNLWDLVSINILQESLEQYLGGTPQSAKEAYNNASPTLQAYEGIAPTLLLHGKLDKIPYQQSEHFYHRLKALNNISEFVLFLNDAHNWFLKEAHPGKTIKAIEDFISRHLNS